MWKDKLEGEDKMDQQETEQKCGLRKMKLKETHIQTLLFCHFRSLCRDVHFLCKTYKYCLRQRCYYHLNIGDLAQLRHSFMQHWLTYL